MRSSSDALTRTVTSAVCSIIQSHDATRAEAFAVINTPVRPG